ncbi:DUF1524 domain-containing protein [Nocardioidaceae bacterium]|nr:DUF1524 domain-containing protein [Nocardioidaceae bacterium]
MTRRTTPGLLAATVVLALSGCVPPTGPAEAPSRTDGAAAAALGDLPVQRHASPTDYDRDAFGQPWLDADRNGCDTRNDILGEQLDDPTFKPGTRDCKVLTGLLEDPYTGAPIAFDDADGDGSGIDVDHVVALGNAWVTGAAGRDASELAALANDPLNLLAVDAGANRSKGDGDAATWLPPRRSVRCAYVARQVAVKTKYALWVTAAERMAIARVLDGCPGRALPVDSGAPTSVPFLAGDADDSSCADLAARGLTPVQRGEDAYAPALDGDGDGIACE